MSRNMESDPKLFRITGRERDAEKQSKSVDIQNAPLPKQNKTIPPFASLPKKRKGKDATAEVKTEKR